MTAIAFLLVPIYVEIASDRAEEAVAISSDPARLQNPQSQHGLPDHLFWTWFVDNSRRYLQ